MRISDWSSDVCSSDLGPASGRKRTLWDGSLPFRGEIRRLGSLLPSRSREGPDYVPLSQPSPLKGRGLNVRSPPPKAAVLLALCSAATRALRATLAQLGHMHKPCYTAPHVREESSLRTEENPSE